MTDIRILIYTDPKDISLTPDDPTKPGTWSVSILRDILEAETSPFVKFSVDVVNRYENPQKPRMIDDALLAPFDQIWVFGKYQINVAGRFKEKFGGPDNELKTEEIETLRKWMVTHGVLIAGDHSEMSPLDLRKPEPASIEEFLCLGRALGEKIPRAGELRDWVGPPTSLDASSFNTLVQRRSKEDPDADAVPQQYLLELGFGGMPHPLLTGKDGRDNDTDLDLFPDHIHEGVVILPEKLGDDWPPKNAPEKEKPRPVIIAHGCDKRLCHRRAVLAIYDPPEAVKVGRIIADSTWHHYLNVNIRGLMNSGDPEPILLLQQFYRHVAFFLAPIEKRREVTTAMLDQMLSHPAVWEEKGNEPAAIGKVALKYLSQIATRYEIAEMLQHVMVSEATGTKAANLRGINFPQMSAGITQLPARELVVGHIVSSHYREAARHLQRVDDAEKAASVTDAAPFDPRAAAAEGVKAAFHSHEKRLKQIESVTKEILEILG